MLKFPKIFRFEVFLNLHMVMLVFFHLLAFVVSDYFSPELNKEVRDISRQVVAALFKFMTGINRLKPQEQCCASHKTWESPFFC